MERVNQMKRAFSPIAPNIFRLRVPFGAVYTSVFAVRTDSGDVLIDAAATADDADQIIAPAAEALRLNVRWILLSHSHDDHAGGAPALAAHYTDAVIGLMDEAWAAAHPALCTRLLHDGGSVAETLTVYHLPGHTPDAMGVFDPRTRALICGDCVQAGGVGRYGTGLTDGAAYLRTLERIRAMAPAYLFPAHAYFPLGERASGTDAVSAYLDESRDIALRIAREIRFIDDDRRAADHCNMMHPEWPPIGSGTARAMRIPVERS